MSHDFCEEIRTAGVGVCPGIAIGRAVVFGVNQASSEQERAGEPVILVGHDFSPEEVLSMDSGHVCGFVTETGGVTAPAGIVARSSAMPAVLVCPRICDLVKTGDLLIVDGNSGEVVIRPSPAMIAQYHARHQAHHDQERMDIHRYLPAETKDGLKVDVLANVDLVDGVPTAVTSGAGGIGLLRSEFYYLTGDGAPSEEFLFGLYQHVLASVAPLPVTIRTLDLSGGAQLAGYSEGSEHNPALGLKGLRFSLHHPAVFKTQLRALYRASAFGRLRVLLPMIGSPDELLAAKAVLVEVEEELRLEGHAVGDDVALGIMIEVPAAVFVVESLAQEVDFFSIGVNDLIQYGLAVDRVNGAVAHLYDPLHPALLRMLDQTVKAGHRAGIDVGVCGEMAGDPMCIPVLLGLGVDWLSMPASAIAQAKKVVRSSVAEGCDELAAHLLDQSSSKVANRYLQDYFTTHYAGMTEMKG